MTAAQYFRIFARYGVLVVVCVLGGLLVATLVTDGSGTTYSSIARVQIISNARAENVPGDAYNAGLLAQQRVYTYADLAKGDELTSRVLADHSLHLTAQQLQDRVTVNSAGASTVLTIIVRDSDAARTQLIAERVTVALVKMVKDLESTPAVARPLLRGRVVTHASTPVAAPAPPSSRNPLLGLAVGLVVGLAAAVVASRLDRRLHDARTVQQVVDAPVLGDFSVRRARDPQGAGWESTVREVSAGMLARRSAPGEGLRVAITAPVPDERLRQVVEAVALALADTGSRVLLVDADLRDEHVAPLVASAATGARGLGDHLAGDVAADDLLVRHGTSECYVLPAGKLAAEPAGLLHSAAFQRVLLDARQRYDVALVLAPALSQGTDALAVAAQCDGTLLLVPRKATRRPGLEAARTRLGRVDADLMGAVLL